MSFIIRRGVRDDVISSLQLALDQLIHKRFVIEGDHWWRAVLGSVKDVRVILQLTSDTESMGTVLVYLYDKELFFFYYVNMLSLSPPLEALVILCVQTLWQGRSNYTARGSLLENAQ